MRKTGDSAGQFGKPRISEQVIAPGVINQPQPDSV